MDDPDGDQQNDDTVADEPPDPEPEGDGSEREAELRRQIGALPGSPGCYLFRDAEGRMLYIGKATNLRSRVRSYFQDKTTDTRAFIPWLRRRVARIDSVVTATEKEATVLENTLIKQYRPKYNVKLRDDKQYLSLRLDPEVSFPRLELVRRPTPDRARYFGPYPSATAARRTLRTVERHFQLRTCSDREFLSRRRPCVKYQIKRCPGPCVGLADPERYRAQVRATTLFLEGRHDEVTALLEERMREASQAMDFEVAALLRDQIAAIREVRERQRVVEVSQRDADVVGLYREHDRVELAVLIVRAGRVIDVLHFADVRAKVDDAEVIATFLRVSYDREERAAPIPDEIVLPLLPEGAPGVEAWLEEQRRQSGRSGRAKLTVPKRGQSNKLLDLANENARHAFLQAEKSTSDLSSRLARLAQRLRLPREPKEIECVDISHHGGVDCVGAVVRLSEGKPNKSAYRQYHVHTAEPGNDYQAIFEVLKRRLIRGRDQPDDAAWALPDLLVIDGGRGQLEVALAVLADLEIEGLPVVALAKERESLSVPKLLDRVYLPNQKNPIPVGPAGSELRLLTLIRDEAHRFSNHARRQRGRARTFASVLDEIPTIGPATKKALLSTLGSVQAIRAATDQELALVRGLGSAQIAALRGFFAAEPTLEVADSLSPQGGKADAERPPDPSPLPRKRRKPRDGT